MLAVGVEFIDSQLLAHLHDAGVGQQERELARNVWLQLPLEDVRGDAAVAEVPPAIVEYATEVPGRVAPAQPAQRRAPTPQEARLLFAVFFAARKQVDFK